ncbi:hypothetical protein ACIGFK_41120 [Streptomyces sp. NPDC085524]|uniref:hypothetical protein n=1 Tax=Streptomyces sp. NPDC085524 TaxID=3365728 RepID=UPI0037D49D93
MAAVLALLWLYAYGHAIEVIGAVLAAVLIEATAKPIKKTVHTLRKVLSPAPSGGEC